MSPGDVKRFEAATGPLLDELGYGRAEGSASWEELERASRLREAFADGARARRLAVPEAWERLPA